METTGKRRKSSWVIILFLVICNGILLYNYLTKPDDDHGKLPPAPPMPVPFRTPGGLLEVAGFIKEEELLQQDNLTWWFVNWGTTVSQVRVEAYYRYHVKLSDSWNIRIKDTLCIVEAPAFEPTLPVAVDSAKTVENSESGWLRFNKAENLEQLKKNISGQLERNAKQENYRNFVREHARKTVEEFIRTWLLKEQVWGNDEWYMVKVIFSDEIGQDAVVVSPNIQVEGIKKIVRPQTAQP